jgi:hypothetical protein
MSVLWYIESFYQRQVGECIKAIETTLLQIRAKREKQGNKKQLAIA